MNFDPLNLFSHYAVGTDKSDPLYTLGCVLPDLVRNFNKHMRLKPGTANEAAAAAPPSLGKGIRHHILADKIFHNSRFFLDTTAAFKQLMSDYGFRDRRYRFFTAHVATELLLDRTLIRQNVLMLDTFYKNLSQVSDSNVDMAFRVYDLPNSRGFIAFLNRFRASRYLYHYQNLEGLIFAINRIHERVGLEPFDNQSVDLLVRMDATLQAGGLSIIEDIASELQTA